MGKEGEEEHITASDRFGVPSKMWIYPTYYSEIYCILSLKLLKVRFCAKNRLTERLFAFKIRVLLSHS